MDTSKTRSIKSLLLQAWRERWSDITWGIRIKSVLPRGVSGDVYDLADCILQQALVGPGPNSLFMSYLIHSLSSRVVSYGAVLSSIGRYQSFYKPFCILSLLDLLKTFQCRIGCHGNEEECIALCNAIVNVTHWLYSCIFYSISKLVELKQSPEYVSVIEKSYEILCYFNNSTFIKSLLHVGKFEDQNMYNQMLQKHKELENKINQTSVISVSKEGMESALGLVRSVESLPSLPYEKIPKTNQRLQILSSTINILISINAICKPESDLTMFVNQLLLIKKLQSFTLPQLYCEMLRACFIGIANSSDSEDHKWFAFTFLKAKQIFLQIHSMQIDNEKDAMEKGLDILLQYSPLLNLADSKSNCNCFQYLTNDFCKLGILTEVQLHKLIMKRQKGSIKFGNPKQNQQGTPPVTLILKAELTVQSILRTLNTENLTIQQTLLNLLCHIIQGKNLKLILSAMASTGKLSIFISKLIKLNDIAKFINSENTKLSQIRALLFDVTFLLLCHITQYYGLESVTKNVDSKNLFFVQWALECLADARKFKRPELLLSLSDQNSIESLLSQFLSAEEEFKTVQVKWHEIAINAPPAMKEILVAWQHGALSNEKIESIIDYIKKQMCFLPVCISAWLCNYIDVLHYDERLKPLNLLQQFLTPLQSESSNLLGKSPSSSDQQTSDVSGQSSLFYAERSELMMTVIKKMMCDLYPPPENHSDFNNFKTFCIIPRGLTTRTPLAKNLHKIFSDVHIKGWLDQQAIISFDTFLSIGGAQWLCEALVERILSFQYIKDINRAVDIVLGIFHLDIEQCALVLLLHVLPFYLYNEAHQEQLAEPYGTALSRLTIMTTFAALQSRQCSCVEGSKLACTQNHCELDINRDSGDYLRPSKIHRGNTELLEDTPFKLQSLSDDHLHNAVTNPINKAIADLMRTLLVIASDATLNARSHFPIRFLEQVVLCAKDQAPSMLQFLPLGLVGLLLKKFPEEFSHDLILAVSSMQSSRARKVTALSLCQLTIAQNRLINKKAVLT